MNRFHFLFFALAFTLLLPFSSFADEVDPAVKDCYLAYGKLLTYDARPMGPHIYLKAEPTGLRDFDKIDELKIGQFNVENMYNYRGKWEYDAKGKYVQTAPANVKPQRKWEQLKRVMEFSDDDIMVWEEVEDFSAAMDFSNEKLGGKYRGVLINGNDGRGIDVAVMLKKDLPFDLEVQSYKDLTVPGSKKKMFSRDLPVMSIRRAGSPDTDPPILRIVGTHFKSQRDVPGDPGSVKIRTRQVEATAKIIQSYGKADPGVPLFLIGDFNADIRSAPEFKSLWKAGMKDAFDLAPNPLPKDKRITQSYFPRDGKAVYSQLDGEIGDKAAGEAGIVKTVQIIPYKTPDGQDMPLPTSFDERELQGSDHLKLRLKIDFKKLREQSEK